MWQIDDKRGLTVWYSYKVDDVVRIKFRWSNYRVDKWKVKIFPFNFHSKHADMFHEVEIEANNLEDLQKKSVELLQQLFKYEKKIKEQYHKIDKDYIQIFEIFKKDHP